MPTTKRKATARKSAAKRGKARQSAAKPIDPKPTTRIVPALDLVPDQANVRTRDDRAKATLSASMKQFGPARSGVMSGGVMRAGNGSLEAFVAGGGTEALVVRPEPGQFVVVERDDWSPSEAVGYSIADNRTAELAAWDDPGLAASLESIRSSDVDLAAVGFDDGEIDRLIASLGDDVLATAPPDEFPEKDESIETAHRCPKCGYAWSGKTT